MNNIKYIADTAVFINDNNTSYQYNEMITTFSVRNELKNQQSILKIDIAKMYGLRIENSYPSQIKYVINKAKKTKDFDNLSQTDIEIIAKSLEYPNSILLTDDYSIQNVAFYIGINTESVTSDRNIKYNILWNKQCIGCKKIYNNGNICPICGSKLIRKIKTKKLIKKK